MLLVEADQKPGFISFYPDFGMAPFFIRYATILIISILVLFFLLRPLIMWLLSYESLLDLTAASLGASGTGEPTPERRDEAQADEGKLDPIATAKENLKAIVAKDPQGAANIIKLWLRGKDVDGD
jgi:flagellar biosynthesis/type III secretory pathway M-ring protein FliF/YscJ